MPTDKQREALLLIDTCGDRSSVAVALDGISVDQVTLQERTASSTLLGAIRAVMEGASLYFDHLSGIGVVSGPGSFTGLRIGLATAKGLCESLSIPLVGISRLALLHDVTEGKAELSVLRAGREEVYVREGTISSSAVEWLMPAESLARFVTNRTVAYAEESVHPLLATAASSKFVDLGARHALSLVQVQLRAGANQVAQLDGNYVREEKLIYTQPR